MTRKGVIFTAVNTAEFMEIEMPEIKENEVLVKMEYTAISGGTERACITCMPNTAQKFPARLGYSGVGTVEKAGANVSKFAAGDRVLVYHGFHTNRNIVPESDVIKLPFDNVKSVDAAFVLIAAMGLGGMRKTRLELGESGMVMGLGILGAFALLFMKNSGAVPLIAADLSEQRRSLALKLGADFALNPADDSFADKVKEITGGGVGAIVEVTGASKAMLDALSVSAQQARIALLGCTRVSDCAVDYYRQVHRPGVSLIGAHNFVRPKVDSYPYHWTNEDDCIAIMKLLSHGRISFDDIITDVFNPADAPSVYKRLVGDSDFPVGAAFDWRNIR